MKSRYLVAAIAMVFAMPSVANAASSALTGGPGATLTKTATPRVGPSAPGPHFAPTGKAPSAARGESVFIDHCAICHGLHGRGDGPRSAFFQPGSQFIPDFASPGYLVGRDADVLQSIRQGLARLPEPAIVMPQFKYILSDEEIRSVLMYAKSLAVRPARAAATPAEPVVAGSTVAAVGAVPGLGEGGEALAKKYNCLACHQAGQKVVGPAYRDVAARYRGQADAAAKLAEKIRRGSTGNWGNVPMPPKADVGEGDLKKIVDWILSIG